MAAEEITVKVEGEERQYPTGVSIQKIAKDYQNKYQDDIVLAIMDGKLKELNATLDADGEIDQFVTSADKMGNKAYRRSMTLLMQRAIHNCWGEQHIVVHVMYSLGNGYYCELVTGQPGKVIPVTQKMITELKQEMRKLVEEDIPFKKESINTDDAIALFHELGMTDKEKLFRYRRSSKVNLYELGHYKDYFYGYTNEKGENKPGYIDLINKLKEKFPLVKKE